MTTTEMTRRTIVVGYDGSPAARAAVELGIDRATPDGRLVLVHTYNVPADFIGAPYYNDMLADGVRHSADLLEALERDCERLNTVEYETDVITGSAAPAIIRAAAGRSADEIILGSRGLGRVRAMLGSVAHDVLHHAQCPVTVIPDRAVQPADAPPLTGVAAH
jgi:nucleotide-binding universal stress UspA family protein